MILNGLGGPHLMNSARLMNAAQPDYLSTLVASFPFGEEHFAESFIQNNSQSFHQCSQTP